MYLVVDILYLLGFVLASPWLLYRFVRTRGWQSFADRFRMPEAPTGAVWFHGASVGEVSLIRPLVRLLEERRPGLPIVITSHTETGVRSARLAYPGHSVFRFPFDFSWIQRRLMRSLRPDLVVVIESDLWPNHLLAAARDRVPIAVINAKLSERSTRLHRWSRLIPRALRGVALVAAQTEAHAARFERLGVPADRVVVTGNMKYDLTADDSDPDVRLRLRQALGFGAEEIVIIGGSLHPGEDKDVIAAFESTQRENLPTRLVIVPRYPDQAGEVVRNARSRGIQAVTRSELNRRESGALDTAEALVVDTLGELRQLYAAADIAFVGGSLYYRGANKGGHNLMEPAILGLPVVFGPHNFSFRETVADLLSAGAGVMVRDRAELTAVIDGLVRKRSRRNHLGQSARQVVLDGQGASQRNLELLLPLIDTERGCSANRQQAQSRHQPQGQVLNE